MARQTKEQRRKQRKAKEQRKRESRRQEIIRSAIMSDGLFQAFHAYWFILLGAVKKETFRSGESETRTSKLKRIRTC